MQVFWHTSVNILLFSLTKKESRHSHCNFVLGGMTNFVSCVQGIRLVEFGSKADLNFPLIAILRLSYPRRITSFGLVCSQQKRVDAQSLLQRYIARDCNIFFELFPAQEQAPAQLVSLGKR